MTAITLYPHEVRRLQEHGRALLVRPVKPQPGESFSEYLQEDGTYSHISYGWSWFPNGNIGPCIPCPSDEMIRRCPLTPGSIAWGRETWALASPCTDWETGYVEDFAEWRGALPKIKPSNYAVLYKQDWDDPDGLPWRSPVTMPKWACRPQFERLLVGDVRCVRVGELSEADAALTGVVAWHGTVNGTVYKPEFSIEWVRRFGKIAPYMTAWAWAVELSVEGVTP